MASCGQVVEREFYNNGNLKSESTLKNGKIEGLVKNYFEDGSIESVGEWKEDKIHGQLISYFPSGAIRSISLWSNGMQEGESLFYYKSGALMSRSYFVNGNREGKSEVFFDDANLKELKFYDHGAILYLKTFDSLGEVVFDNVLPIVKLRDDTLQVGDRLEMSVDFGYDLSGRVSVDIGTFDSENNFIIDTTLSDDSSLHKDFHYSVGVNEVGKNDIHVRVRHIPNAGDSLSADEVMKKVSFFVKK